MAARLGDDEVRRLRALGITTSDILWRRLGERPNDGIDQLARQMAIPRDRLVEALISLADRDLSFAEGVRGPVAQGTIELTRVYDGWRKHWLEVAILLLIGVFALLTWRALHTTSTVVVAAREAGAGRLVRTDDLARARLQADSTMFTDPDQVRGLVLRRNISRGQVLRFEDLARLQVVALRDISGGSPLTADAIALNWSPYQPEALTDPTRAIGQRSRRTIKSGEIISAYDVDPSASSTPRAP